MAYDRIDYELGTPGVEEEQVGVHVGMFLCWILNNGFEGELHKQNSQELLVEPRERKIIGRQFLIIACDGKLWEEDLNEEGNQFTASYYHLFYEKDFSETFALQDKGVQRAILYTVEDTWSNYEKIAVVLDNRYQQWKAGQLPRKKRWWMF